MEAEKALKMIKGCGLREKYGVKRIGFFGSLVMKERKEIGDVDVLVEFERGAKTFDNYMNLKFFLEDLFGRKVDLVIADTLKPQIKERVLGEVTYAEGL